MDTTKKHTLHFRGHTWSVKEGTNLRKALLEKGLSPHNGASQQLNCKGLGTCGTCALEMEGSVPAPKGRELWRLNFPPHQREQPLRLACQIKVESELKLTKHPGFWGQDYSESGLGSGSSSGSRG